MEEGAERPTRTGGQSSRPNPEGEVMDLVQRAEVAAKTKAEPAADSAPESSPAPASSETGPGQDPFRLRGGGFTLLVLQPLDLKRQDFFRRLMDRMGQAPNFYRNAPVVVDLETQSDARPINFAELANRLRQHRLIPVGVMNATPEQAQAAANAGLALMPTSRPAALPEPPAGAAVAERPARGPRAVEGAPAAAPGRAAAPAPASSLDRQGALVVAEPVRAGTQVYAQGHDLIVLGPVSPGAEALADGHIHVYGRLRGRALAGVSGDLGARIFCRSLEAELLSIAGRYRVREDMDEKLIGKPVQAFLDSDFLVIEPLG